MRVLLIDLEREWRGGQSQALLLLQGLRARGHEAKLLSVSGAPLAERAAKAGVAVHTARPAARRAHASWTLHALMRQQKFDLIHANEPQALTAAWLAHAQRSVPLVASRRVVFPLRRSRISLARYRAASRIIAISPAVREELLAAGLDAARIEVIADGVEPCAPISADERTCTRSQWGIPADAPVVAYVASLTSEKGHDLLLEAFAELNHMIPGCHLLLAGSGQLRDPLQQKARAAGLSARVHFLGFVEEPRRVYAASDVLLFPSLQEGLGSSLLDAMSCALPVVALSGTAPAAVLEDERDGLVVAPAATLLAGAAALLVRDRVLANRLGEAARKKVAENFSAAKMVDATVSVYERLIASH